MWPFRRREASSDSDAVDGYTEKILDQMETSAAGESETRDAVAAVEIAASMIGRAFASAEPQPAHPLLTPGYLELLGRSLVTRGELVSVLEVMDGELRLFPACSWDLTGGQDPMTWKYRVDLPGPSRTRTTRRLPAEQVVHCRVNVLPTEPWRGRSPLEHAKLSAELLRRIEQNLTAEHKVQPSRIAPTIHSDAADMKTYARRLKKGGIHVLGGRSTWNLERRSSVRPPGYRNGSVRCPTRARSDARPGLGQFAGRRPHGRPHGLRHPRRARLRWRRHGRERRLQTLSGGAPSRRLGRICAAEFAAKLEVSDLKLDFSELMASDIAGRARAFQALVGAGMDLAKAAGLAGLMTSDEAT